MYLKMFNGHWCKAKDWSRESVVNETGAIREIFVVGLVRYTISRVLPLWLAQLDCNDLVEAAMHRESPLVHLLSLSVQSIGLLEMPVGRRVAGLLLLHATVPAGQLQLVRPLGVG